MCLEEIQRAFYYTDSKRSISRLKGKIYSSCVRSNDICIYESETWPMKVENKQRLEMTEWMMVRHICGVTLKHIKSCEELRQLHGIDSVSDVLRRTG